MARRISQYVVRGWIDNTCRDVVLGAIEIAGWKEPLHLDLAGNCWRDLAGCRCEFRNPDPVPAGAPVDALHRSQQGAVGDMTASRRVREFDGRLPRLACGNTARVGRPEARANALYLEWFSQSDGRVVIESTGFSVHVGEPQWHMSDAEEAAQREANSQAMMAFLDGLERALQPDRPPRVADRMDEFEWERFLRECDARTERFGELIDKHGDDPDGEAAIAKGMGWEPDLEELGRPDWCDADLAELDELMALEPDDPDPDREGTDWVRQEDGSITHPLTARAGRITRIIREAAHHTGLLESDAAGPGADALRQVVEASMGMTGKLAGALSSTSRGVPSPPGMIIATLKRSLDRLRLTLNALKVLDELGIMPDHMETFERELFAIRDRVLVIIMDLRNT